MFKCCLVVQQPTLLSFCLVENLQAVSGVTTSSNVSYPLHSPIPMGEKKQIR